MNTDHNGIDKNTCRDPDSGSRNDTSANSNVGVSESFVISQRLKAKDPCVHEELLHRYQDRLLSYLRRLTSNAELATDLSQDVWVKVLTHGVQFQGKSQFSTWLYTIARNRVLDQWR